MLLAMSTGCGETATLSLESPETFVGRDAGRDAPREIIDAGIRFLDDAEAGDIGVTSTPRGGFCLDSAFCEAGDMCAASGQSPSPQCVPRGQGNVGDSCRSHLACASGRCVGGSCASACKNELDCEPGLHCSSLGFGPDATRYGYTEFGALACVADSLCGERCGAGEHCESDSPSETYCVAGSCRLPADCPRGTFCYQQFQPTRANICIFEPAATNCIQGEILLPVLGYRCALPYSCNLAEADCPSGYSCQPAVEIGVPSDQGFCSRN